MGAASVGKPESENASRFGLQKGDSMVPGVPCADRGNWGSECDARVCIVCSLFVNNKCFVKTVLQIFMSFTLYSYKNGHAIRGKLSTTRSKRSIGSRKRFKDLF